MTESEQGRGNNLPVRDVPIDWESLEDAFENNAPEVHSYLHLVSGEVLRVVDGIADPEMHARIASDAAYLRIEPVSSREQYRWMERFIPMVDEPVLRGQLSQAIDGKGAFRRFKDVLIGFTAGARALVRVPQRAAARFHGGVARRARAARRSAPDVPSRRVVAAREHRDRARSAHAPQGRRRASPAAARGGRGSRQQRISRR